MVDLEIMVPAVPIAQPRQRHRTVQTKSGSFVQNYTPSKHPIQTFKATVRMAFREAYDGPPLTGPLRCDLVFVMPRPKRLIWKTRAMPREPHTARPDVDNLCKGIFDSLKALAWIDDTQVCQCFIEKWIAAGDEQPHAVIRIVEMGLPLETI